VKLYETNSNYIKLYETNRIAPGSFISLDFRVSCSAPIGLCGLRDASSIFQAVGTGEIADLESKLNNWLISEIEPKGWKVSRTNMVSYQTSDPFDVPAPGATIVVWFEEKKSD
jgi:hypothetical protein